VRSQLVYEAGFKIQNRFLLATTAMRATRVMHIVTTRTEDTLNRVLVELALGGKIEAPPEIPAPPAIIEDPALLFDDYGINSSPLTNE
jgi:hypothetical protein